MLRTLLLPLALAATQPAAAGPWLRGEGDVFLSFGATILPPEAGGGSPRPDPALYAEWGATERLTLVFSAFSGDGGRDVQAEILAVIAPPLPVPAGDALSVAGGVALRRVEARGPDTEPLILAAIAWGRGLERGWLSAEARITVSGEDGGAEGKIDLTWGRHFGDRWSGYLQVTAGTGYSGDPYAKVAPTAILRLSERARVTAGIVQELTGDAETAVSLGTWIEF